MSFMDQYPTERSPQEVESELKITLSTLIAEALRKTASERSEGLVCDEDLIGKIKNVINIMPLVNMIGGNKEYSRLSLNEILDIVLRGSNDTGIIALKEQVDQAYQSVQEEFEQTDEYAKLKELYERALKGDNSVSAKIIDLQNVCGNVSATEQPNGGIKLMHVRDSRSSLILPQYDKNVVIRDGEITVEPDRIDRNDRNEDLRAE